MGHNSKVPPELEENMLEGGWERLLTHSVSACQTQGQRRRQPVCPIHNRSNHSMRSFPQSWRPDMQLMERICPHGVGHPDPDDLKTRNGEMVHGCDGCCA